MEGMGVPTQARLRKPSEFLQVRSLGDRIHCGSFIFQCRSVENSSEIRLGVIASRRVGNAVKRNYGKRLFRELFRLHKMKLPPGSDLVVVIRRDFDARSFEDLEARFLRACRHVSERRARGALNQKDFN